MQLQMLTFKDRGMVMAMAKAKEEGKKIVICASTGNTSASAAAYATIPLSLKEPVGFAPSYFTWSSMPNFSDIRSQYMSGVCPSFNVSDGVASFTGKYVLNSSVIVGIDENPEASITESGYIVKKIYPVEGV
jgi:hypothetical protein